MFIFWVVVTSFLPGQKLRISKHKDLAFWTLDYMLDTPIVFLGLYAQLALCWPRCVHRYHWRVLVRGALQCAPIPVG